MKTTRTRTRIDPGDVCAVDILDFDARARAAHVLFGLFQNLRKLLPLQDFKLMHGGTAHAIVPHLRGEASGARGNGVAPPGNL